MSDLTSIGVKKKDLERLRDEKDSTKKPMHWIISEALDLYFNKAKKK